MKFIQLLAVLLLIATTMPPENVFAEQKSQPNILWLFAEDTSPWMGCYGDPINQGHTPNIDSLADRGVRFSRAYVPAPVCSPCRSAMMAGMNQIRFGAHEHRSSRGPVTIHLPDGVKLLPQLMKENGYFTFNLGKTDYNFAWNQDATYSLQQRRRSPVPWNKIKNSQPFFGQIQTAGGKNRTDKFPDDRKVDPKTVTVPPDYPQNELYHETVAQHYDAIRMDNDFIGEVLDGLEQFGLADNTIVVYFSDHGANNLVRHKQMTTEGGLHVPFIIAGPSPYVPAPSVRDDLVNMLDLSATTLAWAGVKIPEWYEGQNLFAEVLVPRTFVAAAKDRLDHTIDRVRSLRTRRFRYTRNFKTDRIFLQPQYRDDRPFLVNLHELYQSGTLSPKLTEIYFGERPAEEFYDVQQDPSQINNLIDDPEYAAEIKRHRELLVRWLEKGDRGENEEPLEELAYQANGHKWGEGVNPEYEVVREDSDGDGLSDDWERINGRDSNDGDLQFGFDNGGWQTEGWEAVDESIGNIAGRLGWLDFKLVGGRAAIVRDGLKLDASKNAAPLKLSLDAPAGTEVTLSARTEGDRLEPVVTATCGKSGVQTLTLPVDWKGTVRALRLDFAGPAGAVLKIDSID
jgi:arylsulfatase A-like enzyme